jgi:hypothetical protein
MGSTINTRCTRCGLEGTELWWGVGMSPIWSLFEHRLYHCKSCSTLQSARVLRADRELLETLAVESTVWAGRSPKLTMRELAELLMSARRWPRCGSACGGRLFGSVREGEDGLPEHCPSCRGQLVTSEGDLLWD